MCKTVNLLRPHVIAPEVLRQRTDAYLESADEARVDN